MADIRGSEADATQGVALRRHPVGLQPVLTRAMPAFFIYMRARRPRTQVAPAFLLGRDKSRSLAPAEPRNGRFAAPDV